MSEPIWEDVKRDSLEANLQLEQLLFSDPKNAVFRGNYPDAGGNAREVDVRLRVEDPGRSGEIVNRFLEAKYFEHPHILRYFGAGTLTRGEHTLTYAVTERTDELSSPALRRDEALQFAHDVLSGLEYLHKRDLVYCVLSPRSVALVGTEWKLSDFMQLRLAGIDSSDEALALSTTLDTSPPEAVHGLISPAWDVWSFGKTLQQVLPGYKADMPDAFRSVFLACLNINPASRPNLPQLSGLLNGSRTGDRGPATSTAAHA